MRFGQSSNPTLNKKMFNTILAQEDGEVMTVKGATNKSILLSLLVFLSAAFVWRWAMQDPNSGAVNGLMLTGVIGGLIFALITIFKKEWAPYTSPVYSLLQGCFLGGISAVFERFYPGIAFQAIGLTFAVLFILLVAYRSGIIKPTEKFKMGIVAATGAIAVFYLINMVLGFFGMGVSLFNLGWIGIGIQLIIVAVAALNLVLDFDFIEQGAEQNAPKWMEWYAAFGLIVSLIWLYLEILKLLALLARRN